MKFRTGYIYHLITALVFAGLAIYLWFDSSVVGSIKREFRGILVILLLLWAVFRATNAWFIYKRGKRDETNP
jgi:hypothetical protein